MLGRVVPNSLDVTICPGTSKMVFFGGIPLIPVRCNDTMCLALPYVVFLGASPPLTIEFLVSQ